MTVHEHLPDQPSVAIFLASFNDDITVVGPFCNVLFRPMAKGLALLWRVDPSETKLVLLVLGIEYGDGVAIAYRNHPAGEVGVCR